jgi:hypothetical protein
VEVYTDTGSVFVIKSGCTLARLAEFEVASAKKNGKRDNGRRRTSTLPN